MIFRLSQKLQTKIKTPAPDALPLHQNPYADWSAQLFLADRTQYILISNTASLYSVVLPGKGIRTHTHLVDHALSALRETLQHHHKHHIYSNFIAPASTHVTFAKAFNKNVTGCMNELIFQATFRLIEDQMAPFDVSFFLNNVPISYLATPTSGRYASPLEAFNALPSPTQ